MTKADGSTETERLDAAAVAALYARHADDLRTYLAGLLRDRHLADEVLQATFAKVVERGHEARDGSPRAWLFRVAHNEAMDRRRRSAVEGRVVRASGWWKRTTIEPEQSLVRREAVEQVRQALGRLPADQQEVIRLRIYEEKTFAEIAAQTGKPLGTILTRMRLATKKLADALRGEFEP